MSLLLQGIFNASISAPHISLKHYEFVYDETAGERSAAESNTDSAEGEGAAANEDAQTDGETAEPTDGNADNAEDGNDGVAAVPHSIGYWRHKKHGTRLGGADGRVTFTVISMTVANDMLSLHGSLLKRPFSVPPPDDEDKRTLALVPGLRVGGAADNSDTGKSASSRPSNASGAAAARKTVRWQSESNWDKFSIPGRGEKSASTDADTEDEDEFGYAPKRSATPAPTAGPAPVRSKPVGKGARVKASPAGKSASISRAKAAGAAAPAQGKKIVFAE